MTKQIYFDCNAGICGNMIVGVFLDLGLSESELMQGLKQLNIDLPPISFERVNRRGISAQLFNVTEIHEHAHRHLSHIREIINTSNLSENVKKFAINCFENLAIAEGKVHGVSAEEVGFHEVGALDAIVDIVGAAIGIDSLKADAFFVSPIRVGFGTIQCAHGEIPLPAPATMELLQGFTVFGGEFSGEWATPTGAAILKTLGAKTAPMPSMQILRIGFGAGNRDSEMANVLRVVEGISEESVARGNYEDAYIIEANIDDMNPEGYTYLAEKLLEFGVRDFSYQPIYMKKNRPGTLISIIVDCDQSEAIEDLLLRETTTIGIRRYAVQRRCLEREMINIEVFGEPLALKAVLNEGKITRFAPEYADCARIAAQKNQSLQSVYVEAMLAAEKKGIKYE